jgi:crossover junction endodeoxyribonuclease RuvC
MEEKYIYACDISLSNTGLAIFSENGNPVKITSISTNSKDKHPQRLKVIADSILELRKVYSPLVMIYESGFYRFSISTKAIYKCIGLIEYLFNNVNQYSYAPSTIRKVVCGSGRANKDDVEKVVSRIFPYLSFENQDQSDACAVGLCYFMENGIIK